MLLACAWASQAVMETAYLDPDQNVAHSERVVGAGAEEQEALM